MSTPPFLTLPSGARSFRLATERGRFAALGAGDGVAGTALLLPGFTGSKEDFIGLLAPLAGAGLRVVALDGRGQFETGGPAGEEAYAQDELARDVLAAAGALGGAVHLLGHSLGGLVCRAAVLRDTGPFASLTLMSSGPAEVASAQQDRLRMLLEALPAMGMDAVWEAMQQLGPDGDVVPAGGREAETAALQAFLRRRWLANVPGQLTATARQLMTEPDRVDGLARTGLPVHVLSGSVDDAWPVEQMDTMARRLGARRSVVSGAGHSPNSEYPEETARALVRFWCG